MDKAKVCAEQRCSLYLALTRRQIADAVKRYSYLLGQTELFKHFVDIKVRFEQHMSLVDILTLV